MRQTRLRAARLLAVPLLVLVAVTGCGGGSTGSSEGPGAAEAGGYAERVQAETDQVAGELLPALHSALQVRVTPGTVRFLECDLTGWRYAADVDLFLPAGLAQDDVAAAVAGVMTDLGLEVEERDEDTVVGRRGELSVLLGQASGPPERAFRHLGLTHACASYSDADVDYAASTESSDYASLIPPEALYTPAG